VVPSLSDSLTGTAKTAYDEARLLYENGDYQGALLKLRGSYDQSKDPRLLWNMAACEKNLRHYSEVMRLIDRYVAEGGPLVTAEDRAAAETLVAAVRGFVTDLVIEVDQPGAAVFVDESPIGTTPISGSVRVDMGMRTIRISKDGFVDFTLRRDLPGGQGSRVVVQLAPVRHEGRLRIVAGPKDAIQVDGKVVGTGLWEGVLPSGPHAVHVTAPGMRPHQTEVMVQDNDLNTVHVTLQSEPKPTAVVVQKHEGGVPPWLWVAGGALVVGAGVGAYFLLSPSDEEEFQTPAQGTWGAIPL
jgi:hypothetical protein